ncbi:MAG: DegT/DnrJ/EryC1/StrS family aminotransferase [Patescibacteria group bacterium]|nr:DegT/DnrJ/EryC1/StrS family aminotransferase [Patescibacteria group bacterium]
MKFCQVFRKPIFISLSPNVQRDDIKLAFKLIFKPSLWKNGKANKTLKEKFKNYLEAKYAFSFNSGRSSLIAILDALDIRKGNEVLIQAFTCNAVVNPILERGAKPIFVDIDETLNLDPQDLKQKITNHSKAIIIQHTFGWPAQIDKILKIAKENNLYLIEDCAHSLGAKHQGEKIGTFGDAAFFSFGRDKVISSVFGGIAVTNNKKIASKIKKFQEGLPYPLNSWIFQQLLHPILTRYLVLPAYFISNSFGRIIIGLLHKLSILSKAVYKEEKRGKFSKHFPKKMPNVFSILALNQFKKMNEFNNHRKKIADFYEKELKNKGITLPFLNRLNGDIPCYMRYPILVELNTDEILKKAQKRKIFLNDGWRKSPVVPLDTDLVSMQYLKGSCLKAEKTAESIINLPTHINTSKKDAQKIINFLNQF